MLRSALVWLGFAQPDHTHAHGHSHGHDHRDAGKHGHTHGVIDPTIATTERGIWAIKWSFLILGITAALQLVIVLLSGSVALLADTIHNVGDAATAVPFWIAFLFARRKPSARFTYGLGRVEDLAGVVIVGIILFSALVAGYQAIDRLINPQPITLLGWVAVAYRETYDRASNSTKAVKIPAGAMSITTNRGNEVNCMPFLTRFTRPCSTS